MQLLFVAACVAVAAAARLENTYLPPLGSHTSGGSGSFLNAPRVGGVSHGGATIQSGAASFHGGAGAVNPNAKIGIVRFDAENNGDGTYRFNYETENRISHEEAGQLKSQGAEEINSVQGQFSYVGDDGQTYSIAYTADENGFLPQGAHIPTSPPIPAEILKSLEQNAAEEARGIVDDGSYRSEHQGEGGAGGAFGGRGSGAGGVSNQYLAPRPNAGAGGAAQGGYRY